MISSWSGPPLRRVIRRATDRNSNQQGTRAVADTTLGSAPCCSVSIAWCFELRIPAALNQLTLKDSPSYTGHLGCQTGYSYPLQSEDCNSRRDSLSGSGRPSIVNDYTLLYDLILPALVQSIRTCRSAKGTCVSDDATITYYDQKARVEGSSGAICSKLRV